MPTLESMLGCSFPTPTQTQHCRSCVLVHILSGSKWGGRAGACTCASISWNSFAVRKWHKVQPQQLTSTFTNCNEWMYFKKIPLKVKSFPLDRHRINNHAVPRSRYIRRGRRREPPSGSGRTAPPTAGRTPWIAGPRSWRALASPSSTKRGWGRINSRWKEADSECKKERRVENWCLFFSF